MASLRAHNAGASGVLETLGVVEPDRAPSPATAASLAPGQTSTSMPVAEQAPRRLTSLGLVIVALLSGGGGIGGSWLFGPGGLTDDEALRAQLAELGDKLDEQSDKLDAQARALDVQASESKQLAARVLECESDIREVGDQSRDLTVWIAAAIPQLAAGIEDVAEASGARRVRIALPDLPGRGRR